MWCVMACAANALYPLHCRAERVLELELDRVQKSEDIVSKKEPKPAHT